MSGHSKWHNIRLKKGKADAQRGQLFTKISKEIIVAARSGLPDPEANFRLKMAVARAREANMPMDTIKRAIARAGGEGKGDSYEEIRYEGYGPHGIAAIVDAVTDNRNRTASEMRFLFSRHGGNLGETGCVAWLFEERGIITIPTQGIDQQQLLDSAIVEGVIDVQLAADSADIITEPKALSTVRGHVERDLLARLRKSVSSSGLVLQAKAETQVDPAAAPAVLAFLDALEDHDDVTHVYSNAEIADAVLEALA
ncbi:MAG: YebC/PmpR family DNA-binding transcriptional regulator [Candidatus Eremiobacter antarcticus]|nr:YebC/PmpR family DNA-binding transcriptional regulator [Candidatus Eremiobacteraeota bacterium]MBC5808663.1 YebC/PmpR family DNA-binding transcriptional regulator [Candidatus Eremiobacteraeota bacterium]PZR62151.1 MAG: YebC/PmpR family DNA-binding transcriptional regulator [Candidatus Eremiobacter sp. RRmetagenome_bin22]